MSYTPLRQFDISNVSEEWLPVVCEFPKIFLEISKEVLEYYEKYGTDPNNLSMCNDKKRLINLRFGFEMKSGWIDIVRGFCREVQDMCDQIQADGGDLQYRACIMKEKFGRFEPQGDWEGEDRMTYWDAICEVEHYWREESQKVCEITGKPGSLCKTSSGWVKTLCEEEMGDRYTKIENGL